MNGFHLADLDRPRFCDVVMKGGITSGVVYPKAVVTLAKAFGLKNIGGTSAGAIAAAAAAAAEFAKRRKSTTGGYDLLAGLPALLSWTNDTGNTNLFTFFQPQAKTAALYDTLTGALEANGKAAVILKVLTRATKHFWPWTLIGLLPGAVLAFLEVGFGLWFFGFLWLGIGIVLGILVAIVQFATAFGKSVGGSEGNFFGLCSGMSTDPEKDPATGPSRDGQALTVWLTKYLNELAGLDPDGAPLTFGQLWNPDAPVGTPFPNGDKAICLEMFIRSVCRSEMKIPSKRTSATSPTLISRNSFRRMSWIG